MFGAYTLSEGDYLLASMKTLRILAALALVTGCQSSSDLGAATLRIYSSVSEPTVNAVIEGFKAANPEVTVELFRAATGELTARVAAEVREGGLGADVLWLTDPLSMQQYENDGLMRAFSPAEAGNVLPEYQNPASFGTRLLNMIIVTGNDVDSPPADWDDLATVAGGVAIPDPAFAGSAYAALAYFAQVEGHGLGYFQRLADNGAVQVQSPTDVVTGVAEGVYAAGMTLDQGVRSAIADGSPITLVWPASGAIAIYSPIGVVDATTSGAAERFVDYVLSVPGQQAIASTGWQPIRSDVSWDEPGGATVTVDWSAAFSGQDELLDQYAAIFAP